MESKWVSLAMVLRIEQINVGRNWLVKDELHIVAAQRGLNVLLLHEPYSRSSKLAGLPATFWCVYESQDPVWCTVVITNPAINILRTPIVEPHFVVVGFRYQLVDLFAVLTYFQYSVATQLLLALKKSKLQ